MTIAGPALALAAVVAGIVAAGSFPASRSAGWLVTAAVAALAAGWSQGPRRLAAALVALALVAGALDLRARHGLEAGALPSAARAGEYLDAPGTLVTDPVPGRYSVRAVVRTRGRQVLAVAGRPGSSRLLVLEAGDRLQLRGHLARLGEHEGHWRHRHVTARLAVDEVTAVRPGRGLIVRSAGALRSLLLAGTSTLPAPERGLVAGFVVGDTRAVPDALIGEFRAAGLSHLLAVSGANVAFVLALARPVTGRLPLGGRFTTSVALIAAFAAATRFEPSVLRASVMAGLAATASLAGRPSAGLRLLVLAATALLLADPFLLDSVGFRLSCAASAGILALAGPITSWSAERVPAPAPLREAFATTLAAQIGVAPVLIPTFGPMPLAALPANLLAAPLAGPIMAWTAFTGAVAVTAGRLLPEVSALLALPTQALLAAVAAIAGAGARVPGTLDGRAALGGMAAVAVAVKGRGAGPGAGRRSRRLGGDGDAPPRAAPL